MKKSQGRMCALSGTEAGKPLQGLRFLPRRGGGGGIQRNLKHDTMKYLPAPAPNKSKKKQVRIT